MVKHHTRCSYIPYVYSGVAYNFCIVNAEYSGSDEHITYRAGDGGNVAFLALDAVLSGVVDTIALPYTWSMQNRYGSISIEWR